ncbi:glycosyltransferase family 8 protein [Sphingomonas sp. Leaf21]|uniref:glycosyltransferase family 8 protein n=1 Tax=Sphingomonas sp. Leaf21 TaxID=2876550 RepID=UPI001E5BF0FC|nr:glycosyltransferase [Sphingomonas sp. Leaf21]
MGLTASPSRSCVCYIANKGYLFQSLVSAIQARRFAPEDCSIFLFDLSREQGDESRRIADVCRAKGIDYVWHAPDFLGGLHIMNARMFLDQMLPSDYGEILYLDGDTQIVADLTPLLAFQPQHGRLCAVRDPMVYLDAINRLNDDLRGEIDAFGENYVNSGVFRVRRSTWADISREALSRMSDATRALHFEDQTIINQVTDGRRDYASIRWNFPGFVLGYGLEAIAQPAIVHFMSNPRPWQGSYAPWGKDWHRPYQTVIDEFPEIADYCGVLDLRRKAAYKLKQVAKTYIERRFWENPALLAHIQRMESQVAV